MGLIVSWDAEKHIFSHCFDYIQRKVEDMVFTFFTLPIAFEMLQICRWIVCTQCCTKHWIGFYWRSSECGSTHFFAKHFPNQKKCCTSVNLLTIRAIFCKVSSKPEKVLHFCKIWSQFEQRVEMFLSHINRDKQGKDTFFTKKLISNEIRWILYYVFSRWVKIRGQALST